MKRWNKPRQSHAEAERFLFQAQGELARLQRAGSGTAPQQEGPMQPLADICAERCGLGMTPYLCDRTDCALRRWGHLEARWIGAD